jgi:N-acetylmuramoyl-L-alanine amidase
MSILRRGDRGGAVTEIRAALSALGLIGDPDDDVTTGRHVALDVFDEELDHAVRGFQQRRGLLVDGVVGEATYRALKEASYRLGARTLAHQFGAPMYGDDVATLQARLQDLGFYTGLVDGHFGLQTHNGLMSYQREYGLAHGSPADHPTPFARRNWCAGPGRDCRGSGSSSIPAAAAPIPA